MISIELIAPVNGETLKLAASAQQTSLPSRLLSACFLPFLSSSDSCSTPFKRNSRLLSKWLELLLLLLLLLLLPLLLLVPHPPLLHLVDLLYSHLEPGIEGVESPALFPPCSVPVTYLQDPDLRHQFA